MSDGKIQRQPNCADGDPAALTVTDALERIRDSVSPIRLNRTTALHQALDTILGEDVYAAIDVPGHTNSAVDGYALAADDLPQSGTSTLNLAGEAFAGRPFSGHLQANQCVRIMTGAPVPEGADTVVMQEHVAVEGDGVRIGSGHHRGQNVRQAGEDIRLGSVAVTSGTLITPAVLGLLASIGRVEVQVRRAPRVAFFSTGDELRPIGQPLAPGEIYDSNRYTLYGMLRRLGVQIQDLGIVADEPAALRAALTQAAENADVVLTTGGVSVGEADYVRAILGEIGRVEFWKIAMKPGRPLAFGQLGKCLFFGLPGNPVAVMVAFYQFVRPALQRLAGTREPAALTLQAACTAGLRKRPGRTEYLRGILEPTDRGGLQVRTTGAQGSGILRSMSEANCFIILPHEAGDVAPGQAVTVQPFAGLI